MPYEHMIFDYSVDEEGEVDISRVINHGFYTLDSFLDRMEKEGYEYKDSIFCKKDNGSLDEDKLIVIVHKNDQS